MVENDGVLLTNPVHSLDASKNINAANSMKNFNGRKKIAEIANGANISAVIIRCFTKSPVIFIV